jgi:hypothetical protein
MTGDWAVATGHPVATGAAEQILRAGGNAVDAGVAAGLALGVVQPDLVSVAGVAPIIMYDAATGQVTSQDGVGGWPAAAEVATKAWQVASADDAHVLSRITALQVCGKLGHREALPLALQIATDSQAHMTLRTSAIATIGDLGAEPERTLLASLAEQSPQRLKVAIEAAISRIEGKRGQA